MRTLSTLLIGTLVSLSWLWAADAPPAVHLCILSGQSNMAGLKPEISYTPAMLAAFPKDDVVIVHDAQSGQPIYKWCQDWVSASGEIPNGRGVLYKRLLASIETGMTGKASPTTITFVWMQG